jgi:hypothetical protein
MGCLYILVVNKLYSNESNKLKNAICGPRAVMEILGRGWGYKGGDKGLMGGIGT